MPIFWQWVFGTISVVAFIMATQTSLQMIFGKPKITLDFGEKRFDHQIMLEVAVINLPINRFLHILGVYRNVALGLMAIFEIKESRTGDKVYSDWVKLLSGTNEATQRVDLPSGYIPARFFIITIDEQVGKVYAGNENTAIKNPLELNSGLYVVTIEITVMGMVVLKLDKKLVVQTAKPYAYWVNP